MADVVILGAGLTGLSAAYHLEKNNFFDYKIFDKNPTAGGLCGSIQEQGYTFDYTGHLLHISDPYFENLIFNLMPKSEFNNISRNAFIYSKNVYTAYPYQVNLYGLPTEVIIECIEGFINKKKISNPKNFYQWAMSNFGLGITKNFFVPFQTKIFDYDIKKISASWTGRFVPQTSLNEMLKGSLEQKPIEKGYNSSFYYPKKGGIYSWVKRLADELTNPILNNFELKEIDIKNRELIFTNGHVEKYNQIINTIPLDSLLKKIKEPENINLKNAHKNLLCNSVINFNIGVKNRKLSKDKHWIYFPEEEFPFYRIGFSDNFSEHMTPKNCSALYGEIAFTQRDALYKSDKLKISLKKAKELLNISKEEIDIEKIIHIDHGYVVYNQWREKNLEKVLRQLSSLDINCAGRYGEWKYSSMQEAVLDGKKAAEKINSFVFETLNSQIVSHNMKN